MVFEGLSCSANGRKLQVRDSILPQNRENMCLVEIEETILVFIGVPAFRSRESCTQSNRKSGMCVVPEH